MRHTTAMQCGVNCAKVVLTLLIIHMCETFLYLGLMIPFFTDVSEKFVVQSDVNGKKVKRGM